MKKIILVLFFCLLLSGCSIAEKQDETDANSKYSDMIELVRSYDNFLDASDYFEIDSEMVKLEGGGYRFYIIVDKAKVAMHDVEAIAVEKDVDYTNFMAANVGIFEDVHYTMIPNQANASKNYVAGIVMSGLTNNPETSLYMLVQWTSKDLSKENRQYLKVDVKYHEDVYNQDALDKQ